MYSRTYDAQRFSPLDQINRDNAGTLELVWSHEFGTGRQISGPLVVDGKVLTGDGIVMRLLIQQAGINSARGYNAIDVFALPVTR